MLVIALLISACTAPPAADQAVAEKAAMAAETPAFTAIAPVDLNVFAAASLTGPFSEIGQQFEAAHPGVTVVLNFAGSQQLAQQINEGARADVFASANNKQMGVVIQAGGVVSRTQHTFAQNRLVMIYPKDNPAGLAELKDLAKPDMKLVLAAEEVPVGQYSLDFLDKAVADPTFGLAFKGDVLKNVVSYENTVKAVLAKVALGEADAGIVYFSDISGADADKVDQIDIPDELNVIATYPIATVIDSENPHLAKAFIDYVLSKEGQDILANYNFVPVK
jgi:molybdate transport system substrate-binding protein